MSGLAIEVTIGGDTGKFRRAGRGLRNPRKFMRRVGVLLMSSAVDRLDTVLSQDTDQVRTGKLQASVRVDKQGIGTENTIFELGNYSVTIGSNLAYAAQVHHGGTILPKTGKLLAIPLTARLKRSGLWPRDLDPGREILQFAPSDGRAAGVLLDVEGTLGFGKGPLFALVASVTQKPRPFLYVDSDDQQVIEFELWPQFVRGRLSAEDIAEEGPELAE